MTHPRQSALQDFRFRQRTLQDAINGVRIPDYLGLEPTYRTVYEQLARLRPEMKLQAARACIVADYQSTFEKIDLPHDSALVREGEEFPNPFFLKHLQAKEAQGDTTGEDYSKGYEYWEFYTIRHALNPSTPVILRELNAAHIGTAQDWIYDGVEADMSNVEVSICTPEEVEQSGISDVMFRYPSTE